MTATLFLYKWLAHPSPRPFFSSTSLHSFVSSQNFRSPPPSFAVTSLFPLPARRFSHLRLCALSSLVPPKTSAHRPHRSVTSLFPLPARRFFLCVFVLSRLSFLPKLPLTAPIVQSLPYFHFPLAAFSSASLRSLISRFLPKLPLTVPIVRRHFLISTSRSPLFPLRPCALSSLVPPKTSAHRPHRSVTSLFPLPARRFFLCVFVLSRLSFLPKLPLTAPIVCRHFLISTSRRLSRPAVSLFSPLSAPSSCRTRHFFSVCHRPCRQPSVCLPHVCGREEKKGFVKMRRAGGSFGG